jgi:hypothetical protein
MHTPGIEGQCPRCLATLIETSWRGLIDMTDMGAAGAVTEQVFKCVMCGHWEDSVIRANRLAQHTNVTQEVGA